MMPPDTGGVVRSVGAVYARRIGEIAGLYG
jgi:hypothetical protein